MKSKSPPVASSHCWYMHALLEIVAKSTTQCKYLTTLDILNTHPVALHFANQWMQWCNPLSFSNKTFESVQTINWTFTDIFNVVLFWNLRRGELIYEAHFSSKTIESAVNIKKNRKINAHSSGKTKVNDLSMNMNSVWLIKNNYEINR